MVTTIIVNIGVHAFGEEELCDEILDNKRARYGVLSPKSIDPLCNMRNQTLQIKINEKTTYKTFEKRLNMSIWGNNWNELAIGTIFFSLLDGSRAEIDKPSANFQTLLNKYLDPNGTNHIQVSYYVCVDAGDVLKVENLRFYIPSKEKGHHLAHVHVQERNSGNTCSICILNGKKLAGDNFKKKKKKKAQRIIMDKQEFFIDCWNKMTDGLKVDINHKMGLIKY